MIKIVSAEYLGEFRVRLAFSDNTEGLWDASALLARSGSLLVPLRDPAYFAQFFLELGALCWKNGLELSPHALHQELARAGSLNKIKAAA